MSVSESEYYGDPTNVIAQTGLTPDKLEGVETDAEVTEFVEDRLKGATDEINNFCNRTFFEPVEYVETREGNGSDKLQLRHYPVTEVVEIDARGENLETEDVTIVQRRGFQGQNTGILKRKPGRRPHRNRWNPRTTYEITYMAGWEEPPAVVGSVADDMVVGEVRAAIAANASAEQGGVSTISMDGFSATYDVPSALQSGDITETQHKRLEKLQRLGV